MHGQQNVKKWTTCCPALWVDRESNKVLGRREEGLSQRLEKLGNEDFPNLQFSLNLISANGLTDISSDAFWLQLGGFGSNHI